MGGSSDVVSINETQKQDFHALVQFAEYMVYTTGNRQACTFDNGKIKPKKIGYDTALFYFYSQDPFLSQGLILSIKENYKNKLKTMSNQQDEKISLSI